MQISKNKTSVIAIAILLTISMTTSMLMMPSVSAHQPPWQIPTYAYINASPNPVGIGQNVVVIMWLTNLFSPASGLGNDYRFHNYQLIITGPDLQNQTVNFPIVQDPTSAQDYTFAPSQTGTYTLTFIFPGQAFNTYSHDTSFPSLFGGPVSPETLINDTYQPSQATTNITVQQTQIPFINSYPLPVSYWTRPIYGENPGWYTISSNWLGSGSPVEASAGSWRHRSIWRKQSILRCSTQ